MKPDSREESSWLVKILMHSWSVAEVCSIFRNGVLPLSSGGEPRMMAIVLEVGVSGIALIDDNLRHFTAGTGLFYLATYGFWEEHFPLCRVTPLKCFHMYLYICRYTHTHT